MNLHINRTNYIRGVSACAIMFCHYSLYFSAEIFKWGRALSIMIYTFFVLSGFSIIYFHSNDQATFRNMLKFLKKRILRIFPVYWIYITFALILDLFFDGKILTYHTKTYTDILKSAFCFPAGIFDNYPSTLIPPAWFLSYVVFFYLVYALFRFLGGQKIFIWCERTWMIVILLFNIRGGIAMFKGTWCEYIFSIRFVAILVGCEIALLVSNENVLRWIKKHSSLVWLWFTVSVAAWIVTGMYFDWIINIAIMQLFGYIIPHALFILWIVVIEIRPSAMVNRYFKVDKIIMLVNRCLNYLNKASYSIFLTHFFMLQILMMDFGITGKLWLIYKAATPIILIGIGCLGYQVIEKPINRLVR